MSRNRVPPHNLDAEESLLGAALLRQQIVGDLADRVDPSDFYKPVHQQVWASMLDLHAEGVGIDAITVRDRVPDATMELLLGLQNATPSLSNASRYAEFVVEASRARKLLAHFTVLADRCYTDTPDDVLADIDPSADQLVGRRGDTIDGLSRLDVFTAAARTARSDDPWLIPHITRPRWRTILVASEGSGKGRIALDTPTLTANRGWTTHGDLRVGDVLFDDDGRQCRVTQLHPVRADVPCSVVRFSDGSEITCSDDHPWATIDYKARQKQSANYREATTRTTETLRDTLRARNGHCLNHAIPVAHPLQMNHAELPLDPYLLGVWLGDGRSDGACVTKPDPEIPQAFREAGYTVKQYGVSGGGCPNWGISRSATMPSFKVQLREAGVLDNKHIPATYLGGSIPQRLALLQGLMDTDGHCPPIGRGSQCLEITQTRERMAAGILELVLSLGIKATLSEGTARLNGVDYGPKWRVAFQTDLPVFRIPRKLEAMQPLRTDRARYRYVTAVDACPPVPVRCISVDSPNHLYLTGRTLIPTHNTLMRYLGLHAAAGRDPWNPTHFIDPVRTLYIDVENPDTTILHQIEIANPPIDLEAEAAENYFIWHREGGMNLRERRTQAELERVLQETRPQLVFAGPLYKMYRRGGGEDMEQATIEFLRVLDDFRVRYNFAIFLEHHAPKGSGGFREMNPFGSSALLRWPEFGITLETEGDPAPDETKIALKVGRFRRDREPADWPTQLFRGQLGQREAWAARWAAGRNRRGWTY